MTHPVSIVEFNVMRGDVIPSMWEQLSQCFYVVTNGKRGPSQGRWQVRSSMSSAAPSPVFHT